MTSIYFGQKAVCRICICSFILLFSISIHSCKKLVEIPAPPTMIASENVFTNNETAIAALTGLYVNMTRYVSEGGGFSGSFGVSVLAGLSSDEFSTISSSAPWSNYYTNTLGVNGSFIGSEFWSPLYNYVLKCNSVIEGLSDKAAEALTPSVRQQLFGEAKFMRAFYYFYLVNLYGDLPLAVISDYKFNSLLSRSPKAAVYQQIIADLEEAREQLSADYLAPSLLSKSEHRIRPTKWAANALLARVYLYTDNYSAAEAASSTVINNNVQFEITSLDSVFLKNSKEAIWQIQPTAVNFNTADARTFILPSSGPGTSTDWPVFLSPQLLNSFEKGDTRRYGKNWVDSVIVSGAIYYFPFKYKDNVLNTEITGSNGFEKLTEYQMVLRLAEQYLIRAEARAKQNNLSGAIADLDKIRERANLPLIAVINPDISQSGLIDMIIHERFVELFSEYGHRWLDLKRTGRVDEVMSVVTPLKSSGLKQWQSFQQLYPILFSDVNYAPNLTQNPGYNQ